MCEVIRESLVSCEDRCEWAVTIQTCSDEECFEIESQVRTIGDLNWKSIDVVGPFKEFEEALEMARTIYPEHFKS